MRLSDLIFRGDATVTTVFSGPGRECADAITTRASAQASSLRLGQTLAVHQWTCGASSYLVRAGLDIRSGKTMSLIQQGTMTASTTNTNT